MKAGRLWLLVALGGLLGIWYAWSFTEWLRPEPIEIVPQFRPLPTSQLARASSRVVDGPPGEGGAASPKQPETSTETRGGPRPENGPAEKRVKTTVNRSRSPGIFGGGRDLQPFVFSLDGKYRLTSLRVTEVSATNPVPRVVWWVRSRSGSPPTDAIIYGRAPDTLVSLTAGARPDKLVPGKTYTLFLEAGRRRGQKSFIVPQEAEPPPPDDGDYKPEKDVR